MISKMQYKKYVIKHIFFFFIDKIKTDTLYYTLYIIESFVEW